MKIPPVNQPAPTDRQVQFSEFVDVRTYMPTEITGATEIQPDVHAQRLERALRTAPVGVPCPVVVAANDPAPPDVPPYLRAYKRTCDVLAVTCGLLFMPSLILGWVNPILFAVGPGLVVMSALLTFARGAPLPKAPTSGAHNV